MKNLNFIYVQAALIDYEELGHHHIRKIELILDNDCLKLVDIEDGFCFLCDDFVNNLTRTKRYLLTLDDGSGEIMALIKESTVYSLAPDLDLGSILAIPFLFGISHFDVRYSSNL